ncbi:MAG: nucleoside-diphosphate kinase [Candidatus ainarchaeum sp.]|nr:nucleoside-diphosphate kinase [Candidatus ainarchaeum sp.]
MTNPKKELTFVILKPDAIQRSMIGELISRIERTGLKMVAMKMINATPEQCWKHYNKDEKWFLEKGTKIVENMKKTDRPVEKEAIEYGRDIIDALVKFMTCGPIIPMVFKEIKLLV